MTSDKEGTGKRVSFRFLLFLEVREAEDAQIRILACWTRRALPDLAAELKLTDADFTYAGQAGVLNSDSPIYLFLGLRLAVESEFGVRIRGTTSPYPSVIRWLPYVR